MNATAQRFSLVIFSVLFLIALIVMTASAATTISTNIQTDGTLSVTGASTLTGLTSMVQASSTRLSVVGTAYFGGTATTTISSTGALSVAGALTGTTGSFSSTLGVTGLTSFIQASSTRLSVHDTAYFGGTATTTINSAGNVSVAGTLAVTGATTLTGTATFGGLASTTNLRVGSDNISAISGLIFGFCNLTSVSVAATSTNFADCSGATGVTSSYRVFVQATSSLPAGLIVDAASSTATTGTINVRINNVNAGASTATGAISLNFWAVR